jgi:hypothetical protein
MKTCQGYVSYISEVFARKQLQAGNRSWVIMNWAPMNTLDWAYTRCELINPSLLPDCVVALAEHCRKMDTEYDENEQEAVHSEDTEADGTADYSSSYIDVLAELNIATAKRILADSKQKSSKRRASSTSRAIPSSNSRKKPRYNL